MRLKVASDYSYYRVIIIILLEILVVRVDDIQRNKISICEQTYAKS